MRLKDLIDLEARLGADERADPEGLRSRDRAALARVASPSSDRPVLLSQWLEALRDDGQGSPGERIAAGFRVTRVLLGVLGLLVGWSAAAVLLHYDGSEPINVATYLLVIVGVQLALLALLLLSAPLLRAFPDAPILSELHALLRFISRMAERVVEMASGRLSPERQEALRAARARLRTRSSMYRGVERWLLLDLTQVFSVAFNVGVIACGLRLVAVSDLAFAWSTTLDVTASGFHRVLSALASPFSWAIPDAAPTLELVETTRYWRGSFAGAAAPAIGAVELELAGRWWTFLLSVTVVYGLLPRVLLLGFVRIMQRRALDSLPLDTPEIDRVIRRLGAPVVDMRGSGQSRVPAEAIGELGSRADRERGAPCSLILWKDIPLTAERAAPLVSAGLSASVSAVYKAGGLDFEADASTCRKVAGDAHRVLLLAEGFEAPDKSVRAFLQTLREAVGPRRTVLVSLVEGASGDPSPASMEDVNIWRDRLRLLDDPYLAVEPLEVRS